MVETTPAAKGQRIGNHETVLVRDASFPGLEVAFAYDGGALVGVRVLGVQQVGGLTGLPWRRWERAARAVLASGGGPDLDDVRRRIDELRRDPLLGDERRLRSTELLVEVAAAYRAGVLEGVKDPVGAIARERGVNPSTARGWVFKARKLGLLGPAADRSAGEGLPPKEAVPSRIRTRRRI